MIATKGPVAALLLAACAVVSAAEVPLLDFARHAKLAFLDRNVGAVATTPASPH